MTIPEQAVEAAAKALYAHEFGRGTCEFPAWDHETIRENMRDRFRERARAVIAALPLMGVQRREDAARTLFLMDNPKADWEDEKAFAQRHGLTWPTQSIAKYFLYADAVLALPHTEQPQEGWSAEYDRYIPDIVQNAMLTAWNEICSDTGHHPTDIERNFEGRKGHLGFTPSHWASLTGKFVAETLKRAAAPASPRAEGEWQDIWERIQPSSYERDIIENMRGDYNDGRRIMGSDAKTALGFIDRVYAAAPLPAPPVAEPKAALLAEKQTGAE